MTSMQPEEEPAPEFEVHRESVQSEVEDPRSPGVHDDRPPDPGVDDVPWEP
ncbi:hypothetical protein [Carbonactinospora thermoautotrophica]|uniref:Uncharacterized protein n=1 Tax=Carbonactinospora thermoautotrophica TaxID=1469144 RepID=A0A132MN48_9ACTN|nr:hypothetical protein [Carbonactinospora thermoautotrophica]KWW99287.1 hypothetical protein LI90_921 [Carbonactinospora thermoautotrophica]